MSQLVNKPFNMCDVKFVNMVCMTTIQLHMRWLAAYNSQLWMIFTPTRAPEQCVLQLSFIYSLYTWKSMPNGNKESATRSLTNTSHADKHLEITVALYYTLLRGNLHAHLSTLVSLVILYSMLYSNGPV